MGGFSPMGPKHGIVVAKTNVNGVLKGNAEFDGVSQCHSYRVSLFERRQQYVFAEDIIKMF